MISFRDNNGLMQRIRDRLGGKISVSALLKMLIEKWLSGETKLEL